MTPSRSIRRSPARGTAAAGRARRMRPGLALFAVALTIATAAPGLAAGAEPHVSLPRIERQVMCVTCKIPLNVAQSPQADRERAFIQSLIDKGETEGQIKRALVDQYGASVLGLPSESGFDLTAYLVPLAAVVALVATLLVLLPRWRRRSRDQIARTAPAEPLDPADAARLDSDLARFD